MEVSNKTNTMQPYMNKGDVKITENWNFREESKRITHPYMKLDHEEIDFSFLESNKKGFDLLSHYPNGKKFQS